MTILIFIIILAVLILVHEFGHFLVAKKSGIKVDEFGIGFPPRLKTLFTWQGTKFSLNAIPFGGFVKIFGENPMDQPASEEEKQKHFAHKPRIIQAWVLSAGIIFNILFAWLLISFGFMYGLPMPEEAETKRPVQNARLVVTSVLKDSPAELSGLKTGDVISEIKNEEVLISEINPEIVSEFISQSDGTITLTLIRGNDKFEKEINPASGILEDKKAIGISMGMIGTLRLPPHLAFWEGGKTSINLLYAVTVGLFTFFSEAVFGRADLSQIAGPVGIVGLVGDATNLGFIYLLQFTAFISLNLAIINLLPFPALDGGRLLFLAIEAVRRKSINPKVVGTLNAVGFLLLILLMVVITINDISRFF